MCNMPLCTVSNAEKQTGVSVPFLATQTTQQQQTKQNCCKQLQQYIPSLFPFPFFS
eukprot:m.19571 g.19571  ORF g.19571 m.19571 type:complete len:56 (+) comp8481_c0_seq1:98-265(+)